MRKAWVFAIIILTATVGYFLLPKQPPQSKVKSMLKITSPAFSSGGMIPQKYTCDGEGVSPQLSIAGTPSEAKSMVLIVDDPDAPSGTFTHWLIFNIDPKVSEIKEGKAPAGAALGVNGFGKLEYGGPCPPTGTHNYFFKVFALDTTLNFSASPKKSELESAMSGHILASGELVGKYSRK